MHFDIKFYLEENDDSWYSDLDKNVFKNFERRKKEGSKKKDDGKGDEPPKPEDFEFKPRIKHLVAAAIFLYWIGVFSENNDYISFDVKINSIHLFF